MQVSVENLGNLERKITVQIPAEKLDREINDRLIALSRQVRLDGFRPGKVPLKLVKKIYGARVRSEVVTQLVDNSLRAALVENNLSPLGSPRIENGNYSEYGRDFEYSAVFEILPNFEITDIEGICIERPVAEITEQDVDNMLQNLRQQRIVWQAINCPAAVGNRVLIDFHGTIENKQFAGNHGVNVSLILGYGTMLKEFEDQLINLTPSSQTTFDLQFPDHYSNKDIAGKVANFRVTIHTVEEAILPELDETFARSFDVDNLITLRSTLRTNMEYELHNSIRAVIKRQLIQKILQLNKIPLPKVLVEAEIKKLMQITQLSSPIEDVHQHFLEDEAKRRVILGIIVYHLATINHIKIDDQLVHSRLEQIASSYKDPSEVRQWYEKNPKVLDNVRALVLEEQIIDLLLQHSHITEKTSTFSEIIAS